MASHTRAAVPTVYTHRAQCFYTRGMSLSPEAIREFKDIYRDEFGEELSDEAALECALRVAHLFQLLVHQGASEHPQNEGQL